MSLNNDGLETHEGFHLQLPQIDIVDFREAVEIYKEVLITAVKKRLTGLNESRIGVIFSGGIDSVLIAKLLQREGKNIVCYCIMVEIMKDVTFWVLPVSPVSCKKILEDTQSSVLLNGVRGHKGYDKNR